MSGITGADDAGLEREGFADTPATPSKQAGGTHHKGTKAQCGNDEEAGGPVADQQVSDGVCHALSL
ncbi:hypothetical protein MARINON1_20340 [Marinobacter salarius]|nr:hypothetical protein MBHK15_80087 [Marinobacter salarius]VXB04163.1 hypothetical protein MARINON1_20340 [Marinobacter salarius]